MTLTEKQLHDKRRGKKLRRAKRKAELTPEQIEEREIRVMEKTMEAQALWNKAVAASAPQSDKFEGLCRENSDTPSSSTS